MQMLDFYNSVLKSAGLATQQLEMQVPSEGGVVDVKVSSVYIEDAKEPTALTIDGNSVILPERDILRLGIPEGVYAFHPVCESPLRKDSPIFLRLQKCILRRMNVALAQLTYELTLFAATNSKHISASPQQADFLALVPHINSNTLDKVHTLVTKKLDIQGDPTTRLISIATRRNAPREDKSYSRGCIASFPWNEFRVKDNILGVKGNKKSDIPSIFAVLDYILPSNNELNFYSAYSDDLRAPSLVALLNCAGKVFAQINRIVDIFHNQLTDPEALKTDLSFLIGLDYINKYRNELGEMRGNIGDPVTDQEKQVVANQSVEIRTAPPADVPRPKAPAAPVAQSIVAPQKPANSSLASSIVGTLPAPKKPEPVNSVAPTKTWLDLQEENRQKQMAAQVAQQPVAYQQPVYQQPQYQQPAAQQQMVQVVDPNTGAVYLAPLATMPQQQYQAPAQPQYYAAPVQQQYYAQPQQPVNTNGFQSYGPSQQPQYAPQQYAQQQYVQQPYGAPQYRQQVYGAPVAPAPTSPGRYQAAMAGRGYR